MTLGNGADEICCNDILGDNADDHERRRRKRKRPEPAIVLDVAGGKGDLSWLLKNVDGIESIVLDPWKADPNTVSRNERMVRSIEYLRSHPEEAQKRSVPCLPTYQPLAGLLPRLLEGRSRRLRNKKHMKQHQIEGNENASMTPLSSNVPSKDRENSDTVIDDSLLNDTDGPCHPGDFLTPQILHMPLDDSVVQKVRARINHDSNLEESQATDAATTNTDDKNNDCKQNYHDEEELLNLLTSGRIKLVVGFHPDQATEPCIDLARILGIPYCVVPCCVFPSEFPYRRVRENEEKLVRVRTYQQFMAYLKAKAAVPIPGSTPSQLDHRPSEMHTSYLNFPFTETAKNIVLYSLPP